MMLETMFYFMFSFIYDFLTVSTCFTDSFPYSRFNIDNKYGRVALEATFKAIMGYEQPMVKPPTDYRGDFFKGKLSLCQLFVTFLPRNFVDHFPS